MMRRRGFLGTWLGSVLLAAFLLAAGLPGPASAEEFGPGAKKFIENLTEQAISMLTGKELSKTERADRFRKLMKKTFAIKGIAKFVLGRHWRKATDGEKKEYLELFEDLLVVTYADRFAKYSGEKLVVNEAAVHGKNDAVVNSRMIRVDGSKSLRVDWRVRKKAEKYVIVDIMVEGISMVITQKSEFASFVKKNGGSMSALLDELRKRIQTST
ncbi:MAG: ABC transporter substrate-binding protein [Rhodospirillales bacterium]|nr:ABC transporter substrate-binding protein [Rhodospirillales bacterium]